MLKKSAEQIYDLIKATNVVSFPQVDIVALTYGTPAVLTGDPSGKDTSLVVSAAVNTPYTGNVTIKYDRLDLEGFETTYGATQLIVPEGATPADIVAAFNSHYECELESVDYQNNAVPTPPDFDGESYTLVAAAGSLAYKGDIVLSILLASTPLSEIITVTELDGLEFPEA